MKKLIKEYKSGDLVVINITGRASSFYYGIQKCVLILKTIPTKPPLDYAYKVLFIERTNNKVGVILGSDIVL